MDNQEVNKEAELQEESFSNFYKLLQQALTLAAEIQGVALVDIATLQAGGIVALPKVYVTLAGNKIEVDLSLKKV